MLVFGFIGKENFKEQQKKYARVKSAYNSKWEVLKKEIETKNLNLSNVILYFRVFKFEKKFEVWMKNKNEQAYILLKTLPICASSGELGPKRAEGDGQVPEGCYQISDFNPVSSYHLSLKVNYPNKSDKVRGGAKLGGDIMVHGNCVTIGCIPLQNEPIEEVYLLATEAKNSGNQIAIQIFPCELTPENFKKVLADYSNEKQTFWKELQPAYSYFEKHKQLNTFTINKSGAYVFTH